MDDRLKDRIVFIYMTILILGYALFLICMLMEK